MPQDDSASGAQQANPGYAAFQIARARTTSEQHGDAATRERARAKAQKWMGVLEGLLSGQCAVGSRQPMPDAPVWATPEVVTGGFVTGQLLAGGPLRPHEREIASRIGVEAADDNRQRLNAWFLSNVGFAELTERLSSGRYEVEVPEEAALLVAAWLAQNGAADEARELVEAIAPHFARLRFYPKPAEHPMPQGARIFLENVGTVLNRLQSIQPNPLILAQREAIQVWMPLYEQMISLFLETVTGDVPVILQPVTASEANTGGLAAGTEVPVSIARKVERCICDTADVLVERGIVTSGETLARVIPQFTANLRASAFEHPQLRALYAAAYRAFRRRRSLLLFNLEKQVQIEELPWVAAIERRRRQDLTSRDLSRQTLKVVAALTLHAFPQAIIPNKLLQEFRALAKGGELDLPFVEELAADIFMDDFSPKFTQSAKQAAAYVEGTLYARYYGLDCAAVQRLPDTKPEPRRWSWFNREAPANPFAALCIQRAAAEEGKRWDVARNGMVIEQSQILTTHNLALVFGSLGLERELKSHLREVAENCVAWICRRQQAKSTKWHAKLIMLKQTAYAWRQMVFYLSRLPHEESGQFIAWANSHLREQSADSTASSAT